jgi:hypothetical protein
MHMHMHVELVVCCLCMSRSCRNKLASYSASPSVARGPAILHVDTKISTASILNRMQILEPELQLLRPISSFSLSSFGTRT